MELAGAVCLVTGASSGIGRAAAVALSRAGAKVVALGRDAAALEQVARETGGAPLVADLAQAGAAARAAAAAAEPFGPVDVLVSNAGVGLRGPLAEADPERLAELVAVNLSAPLALTRALLPGMLERRRGHLVFVASIAGHLGVKEEAAYAATKGGLVILGESLRQELAGSGVSVSVVSPGVVETGFFDRRGAAYHRARPRPVPADRVGRAVAAAVRRDRAVVIVPGWLAVPARVHGLLPGLYRALATRLG